MALEKLIEFKNTSYKSKPRFKFIRIDEVREMLHYDPETGILKWKVIRGSTIRPGDEAQLGQMSLMGIRFPTTHVIWFLMTEKWPDGIIENINRNKNDNRWKNLRDTSYQVSIVNSQMAGEQELIKELSSGQYAVNIDAGGQMIVVGVYSKFEIASKVFQACSYIRDIMKEQKIGS